MATKRRELDSDPPPSYNSVIGQTESIEPPQDPVPSSLRRRLRPEDETHERADGDETNNQMHNDQLGPLADQESPRDHQEDEQHPSDPTNSPADPSQLQRTTATSQTTDEAVSRTSLWDRFKKGLEDIVMLVIQILD